MKLLRQLSDVLDSLPVWAQFALGGFLTIYSIASVYGRINVGFGSKLFSRVPADEIRSNKAHVFQYTILPLIVTVFYFAAMSAKE